MAKGDVISRKNLLKNLRREIRDAKADAEEHGGENILWAEGLEFAMEMVSIEPAVDAVTVVRCKHCVYLSEGAYGEMVCSLHKGLAKVGEFTFCSYGSRREE